LLKSVIAYAIATILSTFVASVSKLIFQWFKCDSLAKLKAGESMD